MVGKLHFFQQRTVHHASVRLKQFHLIHVNSLESFSSCKDESMILIFGFSFSYFCWTRQFYPIYFLRKVTVTELEIYEFFYK